MTESKSGWAVALVAFVALGLTGCTASKPQPTVRSAGTTAPADLQLLCASEASTRFGANRDTILPVSSSQEGSNRYRVDLTMAGESAVCVISDTGIVESLQKV
ncbi:hypothetical protein K1W69_08565 [Hoeflea sp. WL0058]|uniref:Lipoprotein n=1 Tax=Flavimaribacter sediminis TaxID=2865987 RepID=A0AAE3D150_9HYPH|nr:hypothetical protein [Flavimaribacter sediminis]MBW8637238.1 hypothetical protein [Flavimaribacter sediminis]